MKNKTVYVPLAVDLLHSAHISILKKAKKYGKVIVGLMTDKAISEYKQLPTLDYSERYEILSGVKFIDKIVEQKNWDYTENINKYKPDFFIHGDDWKSGIQKNQRKKVIRALKKIKSKLIEVPFSKNISSSEIKNKILQHDFASENRISRLKRLINAKKIVRVLESHNSLTGLIIENLKISKKNKFKEYDGMWSSSLTDSATKGKPDNSSVDFSSRISSLNDMMEVTTKLLIFDADNGGQLEHLPFLVRSLERTAASAIIIEDKVGLKKNSLFKNQSGAKQDNPKHFAKKIKAICESRKNIDFMVIARIESFILGKGLKDALNRAEIYSKAGADAILIHSKEKTSNQIFSFANEFKKNKNFIPLVSVPSTYSKTTEKDLIKNGFKIVIYANQLLRAAYPSMLNTARDILINDRSFEAEKKNKLIPISEIINLVK
jgi:phosphoenolpyruvate phosphomutase / 2-hydroxyethylphosphonate cytidylyltransferase